MRSGEGRLAAGEPTVKPWRLEGARVPASPAALPPVAQRPLAPPATAATVALDAVQKPWRD